MARFKKFSVYQKVSADWESVASVNDIETAEELANKAFEHAARGTDVKIVNNANQRIIYLRGVGLFEVK